MGFGLSMLRALQMMLIRSRRFKVTSFFAIVTEPSLGKLLLREVLLALVGSICAGIGGRCKV